MSKVDWSKQHCGVHRADWFDLCKYMPDVAETIIEGFPEDVYDFTWDVKVHMLMPAQWPCIPNWHYDNVPRVNNVQDWGLVRTDLPMYLYVSGEPLTVFRKDGVITKIEPCTWKRFTQADEHRGTRSEYFQWRGFIRATHKDILPANPRGDAVLRRHSQVYLDVSNFSW
jgi:hypothetical protein